MKKSKGWFLPEDRLLKDHIELQAARLYESVEGDDEEQEITYFIQSCFKITKYGVIEFGLYDAPPSLLRQIFNEVLDHRLKESDK